MKKLFCIIFFTNFCFSQEKELNVFQIDSICSIHQNYGFIDNHFTISNKEKQNIGNGYYELKTFIYPKKETAFIDEPQLNEIKEKVIAEIKENIIIKGTYNLKNNYNNLEKSEIKTEFYYKKNELFFVKIILIKISINNKTLMEEFEFNIDKKITIKNIKNILNLNLEDLLNRFNSEILDFYN